MILSTPLLSTLEISVPLPEITTSNRDKLEALAAGPAIARRGYQGAQSGQSAFLAERLQRTGQITAVDVGEAAAAGDLLANQIVQDSGVVGAIY